MIKRKLVCKDYKKGIFVFDCPNCDEELELYIPIVDIIKEYENNR